MAKAKGDPKSGGRQKGTPNKVTADLKAMIHGALHAKGGQKWLERQMDENANAFLALLGKTLPKDVIVDTTLTIIDDRAETEALIRNLTSVEPPVARPADGKGRIAPVVH